MKPQSLECEALMALIVTLCHLRDSRLQLKAEHPPNKTRFIYNKTRVSVPKSQFAGVKQHFVEGVGAGGCAFITHSGQTPPLIPPASGNYSLNT